MSPSWPGSIRVGEICGEVFVTGDQLNLSAGYTEGHHFPAHALLWLCPHLHCWPGSFNSACYIKSSWLHSNSRQKVKRYAVIAAANYRCSLQVLVNAGHHCFSSQPAHMHRVIAVLRIRASMIYPVSQMRRTLTASGPLPPSTMSTATRCPSERDYALDCAE